MSRRVLLVSVLSVACAVPAAALPPAVDAVATPRPAAAAPPGRTLQLTVTGLARGHHARVTVAGPHHYRRHLTGPVVLRKLRVGTYRITVAPTTAPEGARIYPVRPASKSVVSAKRGAVVRVRYLTVVPRTTKAVPAHAITRITRLHGSQRVVTVPGRSFRKGDVLAAGVSARTPHGLLAKVVSVRRGGAVVVRPTTLLAAVPDGRIDAVQTLSSANRVPDGVGRRLHYRGHDGTMTHPVDGPFGTCTKGVEASVSGSVSITPTFHLSAVWSLLHGVTAASLTADLTERSELEASVRAAASCKGSRDLFAKPITFATFVVYVGSIPIVLQPQLQITLAGKAEVEAAVTTSATQSLTVSAGLQYARGEGVRPVSSVTKKLDHQAPTLTASGSVRVSVNPELTLLIDGVGGPEIGLTGGLELAADINASPWWKLTGYLAGNVGVAVPLLRFDKRATLVRKDWLIAHAPYDATPSISLDKDLAFPWSEDACGFDPDDAHFTVYGSGFAPGEVVSLSSDWTTYDDVTADSDGTFEATEAVGEVPSADHDYYDIDAAGETGRRASTVLELNANSCVSSTESDGEVTLQWGGNGMDSDTELDLVIDGDYFDSTTTDDQGSGGSTVTFTCPDSGSYDWDVEGTDDGHAESNADGPIQRSCTPPGDDAGRQAKRIGPASASVSAAGVR